MNENPIGLWTNTHFPISIDQPLWSQTLTTNLTGAFTTVQAAAHQMKSQHPQGGSIIAISSISALVGGSEQAHYTPTKAGVLSLMQSCACALGKYNIRCNALLPGTIRTQLNEEDLSREEKRRYMEGRVPLGRVGEPRDLAGPAVFLGCEGLSGYVVSFDSLFLWSCAFLGLRECVLTVFGGRLGRNCWLMVACLLICSKTEAACSGCWGNGRKRIVGTGIEVVDKDREGVVDILFINYIYVHFSNSSSHIARPQYPPFWPFF